MAQMWGADPEELDALARTMGDASERLRGTAAQLHSSYHQSPWRGPDAERHRAAWDASLHRNLLSVSDELGQWQQTLKAQAAQQRAASGEGARLVGGVSGVTPVPALQPADVSSTRSGPAQSNEDEYVVEGGRLVHKVAGHVSDGQATHVLTHSASGESDESTAFSGWQVNDGTERSIDAEGARVAAHADASIGMHTSQEHSQELAGGLTGSYGSTGSLGAGVNSDASATFGARGIAASVGFNAEAAARDGVNVGVSNKWFSAGAGAELYGGAAATGLVSGSVTADNIGLSCKLGAAIGIGGALNFNVSVNPSELVKEFPKWPW